MRAAVEVGTTAESVAEPVQGFLRLEEAERRKLGDQGRVLVQDQFTWSQIARDFVRIYEWISEIGPQPGDLLFQE